MMKVVWPIVGIFIAFLTICDSIQASEIKIGIPEHTDAFIDSLLASKDLKSAGINLVTATFGNDKEVLDATVDGSIEIGLFALAALDQIPISESLRLYTAFTRPFFFHSGEEIFSIQDTGLGDAILSDLRRAHIFPLKFWNRGVSQIVSRTPIDSVQAFRGLKVAAPAAPSSNTPTLVSLGAEPTLLEAGEPLSSVLSQGDAAIWEPWNRYNASRPHASVKKDFAGISGQIFSTDFEPIIGILSASEQYWTSLSERERQAWKLAIHEASRRSRSQINVAEQNASRASKIKFISPSDEDRLQLIANTVGRDATKTEKKRIEIDLQTFEDAKSRLRVSEDALKKKN